MDSALLTTDLLEEMKNKLKARLSQQRFEHTLSVAKTAVELARVYKVDELKAQVAGLLHDWDKSFTNEELRQRVKELEIKRDLESLESMPHLLHGITAAADLKREFPVLDDEILDAVESHSSGAIDMTDLAKVIYVADVIEPLRAYPELQRLREEVGKVSLEELFVITLQHVFLHLVSSRSRIHPDTITVWNHHISLLRKEKNEKGAM